MTKPPLKYIQAQVDRHGHPRHYFRRRGYPRVTLPGFPYSLEFMEAYAAAMAGQAPPQHTVIDRVALLGTMNYLRISYYNSTAFRSLEPSTQGVYRNILDRFCHEHGDKRVNKLERSHIVGMMAKRADKPDSANGLRRVLRATMKHAMDIGMRTDDPTRDVKAIASKSDGFHPITEEEIAQFEAFHPIGSKARLAFALCLFTGQRRSDVVRMGRQHVRDGLLHVKQQKTGAELWIPIPPELEQIIAATPSGQMTFLVTEFGKPFTAAGFGNYFREQFDKAGLEHCSAHGLRKACARRLADKGCTEHEIAAITGHASLREVERYTKGADQKRLAISAMNKLATKVSTPTTGFTKTG